LWYQLDITNIIVFYLFNSREYYKFFANSEMEMRLVLNDLARAHYFLIIDQEKVISPIMADLLSEVQRTRLLFVAQNQNRGSWRPRQVALARLLWRITYPDMTLIQGNDGSTSLLVTLTTDNNHS
jgi:hypothetical protein